MPIRTNSNRIIVTYFESDIRAIFLNFLKILFQAAAKFEKEVDEIQRKIAKVEDQLDIAMSSTKDTADKLEVADKESIDAELQVKTLSA